MLTFELLRQWRVLGFAVFDLSITFLAVILLSPLLSLGMKKLGWHVPRRSWVLWTLPVAFLVHILTNTETPLTQQLLDPNSHYLEKNGSVSSFSFWVGVKM